VRILFDQGTPVPLREFLSAHEVATTFEMGWSDLSNGDLLVAAEKQFEVFITTDQQLRYQQNLSNRRIAVLVLPSASWPKLRLDAPAIAAAVAHLTPGAFVEFQSRSP
jgi:hypothetical protein